MQIEHCLLACQARQNKNPPAQRNYHCDTVLAGVFPKQTVKKTIFPFLTWLHFCRFKFKQLKEWWYCKPLKEWWYCKQLKEWWYCKQLKEWWYCITDWHCCGSFLVITEFNQFRKIITAESKIMTGWQARGLWSWPVLRLFYPPQATEPVYFCIPITTCNMWHVRQVNKHYLWLL